MIFKVSRFQDTSGSASPGKPPAMCAMSPRVRVGRSSRYTSTPTPRIATSAGGTARVSFGST
ncbi:hypothetical protein D3C76_1133930 [compost metagenome]